tara:strand:- start:128 stop:1123 length:996 start_codon:yes stop_codon:yes gene_type:complete
MSIDQTKKSNRLLGNRRFTSDALNTSQEAFTDVLDLGAGEVYTEAHLIPSSNLPFSGSSQSGETSGVLKYYFRQRLTRSNVANDVFFFMVPTGSTGGVTPQLIQDGQQGSFISPKYSVSSLANSNTEDGTPGYGVKVFKSTSLDSGSLGGSDIVSVNDYQFDFKTGVLQFESALSSNLEVYMSAYQYVGKTLRTGLFVSGSINAESGSFTPAGDDLIDLGSSTFQWKDLHLDGIANIDTLSLTDGFTYNGVTLNTSGSSSDHLEVTGSGFTFKSTDSSDLFTLVNNSNEISVQIDDKVIVLGESSTTPTAVKGGMFYSGSQWFLGYENSPT